MIRAGSAKADISPPVGLPLSGFAVRQNKPSTGIDDCLTVKALALSSDTENVLLISYDLLSLDFQLDHQIREQLRAVYRDQFSDSHILITSTHTHSAPPTMPIAGETRVPDTYIQKIIAATISAMSQALENRQEASLYHASTRLEGINRNRRQAQYPQALVERFPLDPNLDLFVFKTQAGKCQAGVVRFSCHAVTKCNMTVSADYPGELTRRLEAILGAPVLFLQGTAGDTNPTATGQDHAGMLHFVDRIMAQIKQLPANLDLLADPSLLIESRQMTLEFAPFPDRKVIVEKIARNNRILNGDTTSPDLQPLLEEYAGWRLADNPDRHGTIMHWAGVFKEAAEITLKAIDHPEHYQGMTFCMTTLNLGPFNLLFLSGEILTTFGRQITDLYPHLQIKVISYLSPIVGYIGTQEDYRIGGYEPDSSSMWYCLPGPFREDIGRDILSQLKLVFSDIDQSFLGSSS